MNASSLVGRKIDDVIRIFGYLPHGTDATRLTLGR
ncbi:hypothetical protein RCCS2_07819 [Roseobacter sp. CCS2]|nr:hypothetical protein RCCS2_07819 [Roseobacter sp. CCS2]